MVEGTGLENQRRKRPQVRILSFPPFLFHENSKNMILVPYVVINARKTRFFDENRAFTGSILATIFEIWVLALVAVFMIVIAILFCNWSHFEFSCHVRIIAHLIFF